MLYEVYSHVHIATQRRYVGITSCGTAKRWRDHVRDARQPKFPIHFAIAEHGPAAFSLDVLEIVDGVEEAAAAEVWWIAHFGSDDPLLGYNANAGGGSHRHPLTQEQRFWRKVDKNGPVPAHCPDLGPCWVWTGGHKSPPQLPYGWFTLDGGRRQTAHKVSFEMANGPVAPGLCVLHRCDNPKCVRPGHLTTGTQAENMADKMVKNRHSTKLSDDDVRAMRRMIQDGSSAAHAGRMFGISRSTAHSIAHGRLWRHITIAA